MLLMWSRSCCLAAVIILLSQALPCFTDCPFYCRECLDDQCLSCLRFSWGHDKRGHLDCHSTCWLECSATCDPETGECLPTYNQDNTRVNYIKCHHNGTRIECPRQCRCRDGQCVSCRRGHYGPKTMCAHQCSTGCVGSRCDGDTGHCTYGCEPLMYGDQCDLSCTGDCSRCDRQTGLCPTTTTTTTTTTKWPEKDASEDKGRSLPEKLAIGAGIVVSLFVVVCVFKWCQRQNTSSEYSDDDSNDLEMLPAAQIQLSPSQNSGPITPEYNSRNYVLDAYTPLFDTGREEEVGGENGSMPQPSAPSPLEFSEPAQPPYREPAQSPYLEPAQPSYREPTQSPYQEPTQSPYWEPAQSPPREPAQSPYQEPAQPPYQEPGQPSYQEPGQPSYQEPGQLSYQESAQPPYRVPAQPSYQEPAQSPHQEPAQPSYRESAESQYQEPAQPSYRKTAQPSYREPAESPYQELAKPSYREPAQPPSSEPAQHSYREPAQPPCREPAQHSYRAPGESPHQEPAQPSYREPAQPAYQEPAQHSYWERAQPPYREPAQHSYREPAESPYRVPAQPQYREQAELPSQPLPSASWEAPPPSRPYEAPPAYSSLFPDQSSKR